MWEFVLAYLRLSKRAVCEMSRGERDFHDYPDAPEADEGWPLHGWTYHCKRCGKAFQI